MRGIINDGIVEAILIVLLVVACICSTKKANVCMDCDDGTKPKNLCLIQMADNGIESGKGDIAGRVPALPVPSNRSLKV